MAGRCHIRRRFLLEAPNTRVKSCGLGGCNLSGGAFSRRGVGAGLGTHAADSTVCRISRIRLCSQALRAATTVLSQNSESAFRVALEVSDSTLTYRRRYRAALQAAAVFDLLLLDGSNPHALAFQLQTMAQHLDALPNPDAPPRGADCLALAKPFADLVALFDRDEISRDDMAQLSARLRGSLDATCDALMDVSDQLSRSYFSHVQVARAFGFGS